MFERYTEFASRALFFARYEVNQQGATALEPEHLLLGLIREGQGLVPRVLALSQVSLESLRHDMEGRSPARERIDTSVEIPFSSDTVRVLRSAAEEADRSRHSHIGTEHLLLGLLREDSSIASSVLIRHGLRLDDVRNTVVKLLAESPTPSKSSNRDDVSEHIDHIRHLVDQLAGMTSPGSEAHTLANHIGELLGEWKQHLAE